MTQRAQDYVSIIDERAGLTADELISRLHPILAQIYATAVLLPIPDVDYADFDGSVDDGEQVRSDLALLFGPRDAIREVFNPFGEDDEPVTGTISDALADIHSDLLRGLTAVRAGNNDAAAAVWRQDFEIHWGHHAVDALRAFHAWRFEGRAT
jgi:hypothetical protein